MSHTALDGDELEAEEKVSYCSPRLAYCWYARDICLVPLQSGLIWILEFLQDRLSEETSEPGFSRLPFRFSEIAKVILDV